MAYKFIQVVFSNPVADREDEFNEWYDNVHIPELLTVPGMLSATRYALHRGGDLPRRGRRRTPSTSTWRLRDGRRRRRDHGQDSAERRQRQVHMSESLDLAELAVVVLDPR